VFSFLSRLFGGGAKPIRLSAAEFVARRDDDALVLDVRTPREFASGHVAGAVNVDVNAPDFERRIGELAQEGLLEPEAPVYLYCRSGNRSSRAARILVDRGYAAATDIGGFGSLRAAGVEVE
jgi:phage shock protein E